MKLTSKLSVAFAALFLACGSLVGCGNQAPTKYKVNLPVGGEYVIAGIEEEGYVAGADVSFTVTVTNEEKEINTVKYDETVLTAEASGGYKFTMPEKDVTLSVTLKDVIHYYLSVTPETLKVDGQVEASLLYGSDPVVSFSVRAKSGADHVQINDKVIKGISEGDVTLAAVVSDKEVATLNLTVGKSDIMSIKDALDAAIVEAPCNEKTGQQANMSSAKLIAGKVIAVSNGKDQTAVDVILDDGTAAIDLKVSKTASDPAPVKVGDVFKVETVLTNYYGLLEGIAADAKQGSSANYLAADALIPMEKEFTPSLVTPVAMSAEQYTAYYTAAEANGKKTGDNRTWTEIKYVTITGTCKTVAEDVAKSKKAFAVTDTLLLDTDMTPESVGVVAEAGKTSTFDAFLVGVNSSKKKSNIIATAQRAKAIESLTISEATKSLLKNNGFELTYTVTPADSWGTVEWKSSDDTVATVKDGVVTAQNKGGEATITLTVGDKTATCVVTVSPDDVPATAATLDKTTLDLKFPGEAKTLKVTPTPNPTTELPQWSVEDPTVAKVEDGKVTPLKVGTTKVIVKYNDTAKAECAINITALHGTTAEDPLTPAEAHEIGVKLGNSKTSDYVYYVSGVITSFYGTNNKSPFLDNTKFEIQVSTWGDNDVKVVKGALVKAHGKLYSGGANYTKIDSKTLVVDSVDNSAIRYVEITGADNKTSVEVGKTLQLTAKAYPEALGGESTFTWASKAEAFATVSDAGLVSGVSAGKVEITATTGTVVGTLEIEVTVPLPEGAVKVEVTTLIGLKAVAKDGTEATISSSTASSVNYKELKLSDVVSLSVNPDGNNGKIYGNGTNWRLYESNNAKLKVNVGSANKILYVKFVYANGNNGSLTYNDAPLATGILQEISGSLSELELGVTHTSGTSKGNVQISQVVVIYIAK